MSYKELTDIAPYYDDFDANKNFFRLLYQPGRAVQARELTQAQTILQNQVSRFSNHFFEDGALILNAKVSINPNKLVLTLDALDAVSAPINPNSFVDRVIKGATSTAVAKVTSIDVDGRLLYVDTLAGQFDVAERIDVVNSNADHTLAIPAFDATINSIDTATVANSEPGIVYINKQFVAMRDQEIIVDPLLNTGKYHVGYVYAESIVTSDDDATLLDPASGSSNQQAPGADRYNVEGILTSYKNAETKPEGFVEVLVYDTSVITKKIEEVEYADILDILARRTYDESGNYVVRPHNIQIAFNDLDETKFDITLSKGKTYVQGFENETVGPTTISIDKERSTRDVDNESHYTVYGVYVDVDNSVTPAEGIFDISSREFVYLMQSDDGVGVIGTDDILKTRIIGVSQSSNTTRLWLEWQPSILDRLSVTSSIRNLDLSTFANILPVDATSQPKSKGLVFELENTEVKSIDANSAIYDDMYLYKSVYRVGSTYTITAPDNDTDFYGSGGIIQLVSSETGKEYTGHTTNAINGSPSSFVIDETAGMLSDGVTSIDVILKRRRGITAERIKTLVTVSAEVQSTGADTFITLNECDIWDLDTLEVSDTGAGIYTNVDIASVKLDRGDTDIVYDYGSIAGLLANKDYRITYKHWNHSAGDYFTVNSYMTAANTTAIPELYRKMKTFISNDKRKSVSLRNVFDFRRKVTDLSIAVSPMPENFIAMDYQYYLSRVDNVYIDYKGGFNISKGVSDLNPDAPVDVPNTMKMFELFIPSFTLEPTDIRVTEYANKRYTMSDIGKLEKRISNLEYYTAQSQLEQTASDMVVTDALGNSKFKNGIFVDDFTSLIPSNTLDPEFLASLDLRRGVLRSSFKMNSLDVINNDDEATLSTAGLKKNASTYTLDFTETTFISTSDASGYMNVNPYSVFSWDGALNLTPATDNWVDTNYLPDIRIDQTDNARRKIDILRQGAQPVWGSWATDILGVTTSAVAAGLNRWNNGITTTSVTTSVTTTTRNTREGFIPRYELSVDDVVNERSVSMESIYYMRPLSITYDAQGLLPGIPLTARFNGVDESGNCTTLITDSEGKCSGVFSLPGNTYKTGNATFELIDTEFIDNPRTQAARDFSATGTLDNRRRTITSIGSIISSIESYTESVISEDTKTSTVQRVTRYRDPVAQSFLVQEDGGAFINSITVFFKSKDDVLPINVSIVENENGYPSQRKLPFSEKFLYPVDVNTSDDGTVGTTFTFDDPVYLNESIEYSFVLTSNSNDYNVFYGEIGGSDLVTGEIIAKQPYTGSLFKSQNASTWTADQTKDLKFELNKCVFGTGAVKSIDFIPNTATMLNGDQDMTLISPNMESLALPGTAFGLKYIFLTGDLPIYVSNKEDNHLESKKTVPDDGSSQFVMTAEFITSNENLTPMLSAERTSIVTVNNLTFDIGGGEFNAGIYVSADVGLTTLSDDLRVIFDAKLPSGSSVRPYYRTSKYVPKYLLIKDSQTPIDSNQRNKELWTYWRQTDGTLTPKSQLTSTKVDDNVGADTDKYYVSGVADYTNFINEADFNTEPLIGVAGFILMTSEEGITSLPDWLTATGYSAGDYVVSDDKLWKCLLNHTSTTTPATGDDDWTQLDMTYAISEVTEEEVAEWRAMRQTSTTSSEVNVGAEYVEYEYEPAEYVDEDFDQFSVKLELISADNINIPKVRNLKAIAVM